MTDQPAQGSTATYCSRWPGEPHAVVTHMNDGISVRRCSACGWIDFADLRAQLDAERERGRRALLAEADVAFGGDGSLPPPVEMVWGYNKGLAAGRSQATEGWEREWGVRVEYEGRGYAEVHRKPGEESARNVAADLSRSQHVVRVGVVSRLVGPWEPAEQDEPVPEQAKARAVARELLTIIPAAIREDVARGRDEDDHLMLAEVFEAALPLVGNPVARPLVLPVAKLAQHMYRAATAEPASGGVVDAASEEADRG